MTCIFAGGLPYRMTEAELALAFSRWGELDASSIRRDWLTGRSKGFGFVEMPNAFEATMAIQQMNGFSVGGRALSVAEAQDQHDAGVEELAERLRGANHLTLPIEEFRDAVRAVLGGSARNIAFLPDTRDLPWPPFSTKLQQLRVVTDGVLDDIAENPLSLWQLRARQFEELISELLSRSGFAEVHLTPESKDRGVDIYALRKSAKGDSLFVVECKRWVPPNHVGLGIVQRLYGVMHWAGATGGLVATTSRFTKPAQTWQHEVKTELALRDFDGIRAWINACRD